MNLLTDSPQSVAEGAAKLHPVLAWLRARYYSLRGENPWEFVVLLVMTAFLMLYGLVLYLSVATR